MADKTKKVRRPHRTVAQRALIIFNSMVIVAALATAGVLSFSNKTLTDITRYQIVPGVLRPTSDTPPGAPLNYLIVGADTSAGLPAGDAVKVGRRDDSADNFRTDTIMVLRVDPKDRTAKLLSFPRDLWVEVPGRSKNRINSAVEGGGGAIKLIQLLKQDFDIPIDHYVQVDFAGFKDLVNTIGGVPIAFDHAARAIHSTPFEIPEPGCYTLDGNQALDFVRIRKDYQIMLNGRWKTDMSGDYGRIKRQQFFLEAVLSRAIAKGIRNPKTLAQLVTLGVASVGLDNTLKTEELLSLGKRFRNFDPSSLQRYSIPADDAVHGGAAVLEMRTTEAEPILAQFRGTTATAGVDAVTPDPGLSPASVSVQVQNGGSVEGQARDVTNDLTALGFNTYSPGDAPDTFTGPTTVLDYGPGKLAQARYVARFITNTVQFQEVPDQTDVDVVVTIAPDWQGTLTTPKADNLVTVPSTTTASTSTTAPVVTAPPTTAPVTTTTVDPFVPRVTPKCG